MLVAALLLTVTATSMTQGVEGIDSSTLSERVCLALNAICCLQFLAVIFFGVSFVENAMNRAYAASDRFVLLVNQYSALCRCVDYANWGQALFPFTMLIPVWSKHPHVDSAVVTLAFLVYTFVCYWFWFGMAEKAADVEQNKRYYRFVEITDAETGRLLPKYFPAQTGTDIDMTPEKWAEMFRLDEGEVAQGRRESIKPTRFVAFLQALLVGFTQDISNYQSSYGYEQGANE
jgi:hypothetical protein